MRLEGECIHNIFAHNVNSIRFFFHVNLHVLFQTGLYSKTLATVDTDVRIEIFVNFKVLVKVRYAAENLPTLITLQPMSFMYDHSIFRLHSQLSTMIRLHLHHMLPVCFKEHLSQQMLTPWRFTLRSSKIMHFGVLHFDIIMVRLCNDGLYTVYRSKL